MSEIAINCFGLNGVCRLCLTHNNELLNIFSFCIEINCKIIDALFKCVPVEIKQEDNFPTLICKICFFELKNFIEFQNKVIYSERKLRDYAEQLKNCLHLKETIKVEECSVENNNQCPRTNENENHEKGIEITPSESVKLENPRPITEPMMIVVHRDPVATNLVNLFNPFTAQLYLPQPQFITTNEIQTRDDVDLSGRSEPKDRDSSEEFKCSHCTKVFPCYSRLETHTRTHTGEKPFYCDMCGKWFSTKGILKQHKQIHSGVKPYKCEKCDLSFRTFYNYREHTLIHVGIKKFKCDGCDKQFTRMNYLRKHKQHHCRGIKDLRRDESVTSRENPGRRLLGDEQETLEKYECRTCSKFFTCEDELNRHQKLHSDDNVEMYDI